MKIKILLMAILATLGFGLAFAAPSQAQASRTWVSGVGDDANPCSRTAPCKTFAGAISKTAASGEINCIDPGGFGGVTITKSITISCPEVEAGVLVAGTNGIVINLPSASDVAIIQGLDIEGLGSGLSGVTMLGNGTAVIRDCTIHHFLTAGVTVAGAAGAKVNILDSYIGFNGNPATPAGGGVNVAGGSSGANANSATVYNTVLDSNVSFAIQVVSNQAAVVGSSKLVGSGAKLVISGTGTVTSYGNNIVRGATAAPTTTSPLM
jgi:hypothetical protein